MAPRTELLKGTLALLILRTLETGPRHGIQIADRIEQMSRGTFSVKAGSLFPALHRLEEEGFVAGEWATSAEGRRVKTYRLTTAGVRQLGAEKRQWHRIATAVSLVLEGE